MKTIDVAEATTTLSDYARRGLRETLVVTKRGKPVAQVVPIIKRPKTLWGAMKGEIEIRGDIVNPLDLEWEATKR